MVVTRKQAELQRKTGQTPQKQTQTTAPVKGNANGKAKKGFDVKKTVSTPGWVYALLICFVSITILSYPQPFQPVGKPTLKHVFFYGWLTAICTGLGVIPFVFLEIVPTYWVGVSNAIASGMMIAATYQLFTEGGTFTDPEDDSSVSTVVRTIIGAVIGLVFVFFTKKFLDHYEDLKVGVLGGIGIGVSFGGHHGSELGVFISASLAFHNVPEGLAMAVVLLPRGVSLLTASLWAIFTSLPQPIMAVPAYLFVKDFIPLLPVGLGFAGGAMAYVAFFELMMEAIEDSDLVTALFSSATSLTTMLFIQNMIDERN